MEAAKTTNDSKIMGETSADADFISYDAPPLDFSFKNITQLAGTPTTTQTSATSSPGRAARNKW